MKFEKIVKVHSYLHKNVTVTVQCINNVKYKN